MMAAIDPANPCTVGRVVGATVSNRDIPLRRPLRGARGLVRVRKVRELTLTADDGTSGCGDASRVDWLADAPCDDDAMLDLLAERIRCDAPPAAALLQWSLDPNRPGAVRSALQTALLDADARRRGLGLADFLAPGRDARALATSALVGDDEPPAMGREAARLAAAGIVSFKVKVGRAHLDDDVAAVGAVREAIGADAELRLDANGAWEPAAALAAWDALAGFAPVFVEEPLRDATRLADLGGRCRVALDESIGSMADLVAAVGRGGAAVLVLKLERVGGPLPALAMAARAHRGGLDVVFTDSIDGGVGRAATLHAAAAAAARNGVAPRAVGLGGLFLLDDGQQPCAAIRACGPGLGTNVAHAEQP